MDSNDTLQVLLDRNGLQSRADLCVKERDRRLEPGQRLGEFREALESGVPCSISFTEGEAVTQQQLDGADVLVIPTRDVRTDREELDAPFTDDELDTIERFVAEGGGLLLMSNHPPFTRHDRVLAERFSVEVNETTLRRPGGDKRITFSAGCLRSEHPTISGGKGGQAVESIVINNGTTISVPPEYAVVRYPSGLADRSGQEQQSDGPVFAAVVPEGHGHGTGRVAVMGDSGFIGSLDSNYPGPGLFGRGDNRSFMINTVRWVGRIEP